MCVYYISTKKTWDAVGYVPRTFTLSSRLHFAQIALVRCIIMSTAVEKQPSITFSFSWVKGSLYTYMHTYTLRHKIEKSKYHVANRREIIALSSSLCKALTERKYQKQLPLKIHIYSSWADFHITLGVWNK